MSCLTPARSNLELRIFADATKDAALIRVFRQGREVDAIRQISSSGYRKAAELVTDNERDKVKRMLYGSLYGSGTLTLSKQLGMSQAEVQQLQNHIESSFPRIKPYKTEVINFAKKNQYVSTLLGRRRFIPNLFSSQQEKVAEGQRQAVNAAVQGTAADIIKEASIAVAKCLRNRQSLSATLVAQIHDELLYEVRLQDAEEFAHILKKQMERAATLAVPLIVNLQQGQRWGTLTPFNINDL